MNACEASLPQRHSDTTPMARLTALYIITLLLLSGLTTADVEKTIFAAPAPPPPSSRTTPPFTLSPYLPILSASTATTTNLRTHLPAMFRSPSHPQGHESWYVLRSLTPNARYEARLCWAASQPAGFRLEAWTLEAVGRSVELRTSLEGYSTKRVAGDAGGQLWGSEDSVILLRVSAWADYFSSNGTWMRDGAGEGVDVEIILDEFVWLGLVPRSLRRTVFYIVGLIPIAYFVSQWVMLWALAVCRAFDEEDQTERTEKRRKES